MIKARRGNAKCIIALVHNLTQFLPDSPPVLSPAVAGCSLNYAECKTKALRMRQDKMPNVTLCLFPAVPLFLPVCLPGVNSASCRKPLVMCAHTPRWPSRRLRHRRNECQPRPVCCLDVSFALFWFYFPFPLHFLLLLLLFCIFITAQFSYFIFLPCGCVSNIFSMLLGA